MNLPTQFITAVHKQYVMLFGVLVMCSSAHAINPPKVNPEPMDVEADVLAKIAREKSKGSSLMEVMQSNGRNMNSSNSCGNVSINNNNNQSNSGIKDMFGKQSTTIITGPVINMANCK